MGFDTGGFAGGAGGGGGGGGANANVALFRSAEVDLTVPAVISCNLPEVIAVGQRFWVNEIGLVITTLNGTVTIQPTASWGINGDTDKYKAAILMLNTTALGLREFFNSLLSDDNIPAGTTPTAEITIGATLGTATQFKGYFYFNGVIF